MPLLGGGGDGGRSEQPGRKVGLGVCNAPTSAPKPTGEAAEKSLGKVKCKGINQLISQGDGLKPTARAVTARGSRVSLSQPSRVPGSRAHFVDSQPKPPKPQSSYSEPAPGSPSRLSPPVCFQEPITAASGLRPRKDFCSSDDSPKATQELHGALQTFQLSEQVKTQGVSPGEASISPLVGTHPLCLPPPPPRGSQVLTPPLSPKPGPKWDPRQQVLAAPATSPLPADSQACFFSALVAPPLNTS